MKHNNFFKYAMLTAAACICFMSGCVTNYGDIDDINLQAEVDMGLGLPVGTMKVTIEDFLSSMGNNIFVGTSEDQYNGVNYNHILLFRDTFSMTRSFTEVHLNKYNTSTTAPLYLYKGTIKGKTVTSPYSIGANAAEADRSMRFPIKMKVPHVKNDQADSLKRMDKMVLSQATLLSKLTKTGYDAFSPTMIERVDLILGKQFERAKGNVVSTPFTAFGTQTKRNIDDFTLNFMYKDLDVDRNTLAEFDANINDSLDFEVVIVFKPSTTITFNNSQYLTYNLAMQDYIYDALYGYFRPGKRMSDRDEIVIEDEWENWKKMKNLELNATQPYVKVSVTTEVSAPLYVHIDTLWVRRASDNLIHYAHFKNGMSNNYYFGEHYLKVTDPIGESITNDFYGDYVDDNGDMDQLFNIRPDYLGYRYKVLIDKNVHNRVGSEIPQHRLTPNYDVNIDTEITVPFIFSEGMNVAYTDTMEVGDVFSKLDFDSIAENVGVIDTVKNMDVNVLIHLKNKLPFDVKFAYEFLDENGKVVKINDLITSHNDTVLIPAPENNDNQQVINNQLNVLEPSEETIVLSVDREKFDLLASITDMRYTAMLQTNSASFKPNSRGDKPKEVVVYDNSDLTIQVKATAQGTAAFDFNSDDDENEQQ